jgi:DNA-binding NtrC family response regulator
MDNARHVGQHRGTVLIVDDDAAIGAVVRMLLADAGYAATLLTAANSDAIRATVGRLEPDCLLLDSAGQRDYGASWLDAVWAHTRGRPVPVVMFTVHQAAIDEATDRLTSRSGAIYAVVAKPFDIDGLLDTVARAVGAAETA